MARAYLERSWGGNECKQLARQTPLSFEGPAVTEQSSLLSAQAYLESFYKFCSLLGGTTADAMCPILEVSACLPFDLLATTGPGMGGTHC